MSVGARRRVSVELVPGAASDYGCGGIEETGWMLEAELLITLTDRRRKRRVRWNCHPGHQLSERTVTLATGAP